MTRNMLALAGVAIVLAWCAAAQATLCPTCKDLMFVGTSGKCIVCGAPTASPALKLCPQCSAALHRCERCLVALDAEAKPLPASD